jgi:hypothetical protein
MTIYKYNDPIKQDKVKPEMVPRPRRKACCGIVVLFGGIAFLGLGLVATVIFARARYAAARKYQYEAFCGVQNQEYKERVEFDDSHERLTMTRVPEIDNRYQLILHDFARNLSVIVDRERARCFIYDLDRAKVLSPTSLMDVIEKKKAGHYTPNITVIKTEYVIRMPKLDNVEKECELSDKSCEIRDECASLDAYRLDKVKGRTLTANKCEYWTGLKNDTMNSVLVNC